MSTQASSSRPLSGISSFQTFLHYAIFLRQEINVNTRTDLFSAIWIWIFHLPPNQQDPVNDSHLSSFSCPFSRSTISESVSDWWTVCLTDSLTSLLTDWLNYWPTYWSLMTNWLTDCVTDWLTVLLTALPTDQSTVLLTYLLSYWLTFGLKGCLTDWPSYWLIDWLTDYPAAILYLLSHKMTYALANRGSINQLIWLVG